MLRAWFRKFSKKIGSFKKPSKETKLN